MVSTVALHRNSLQYIPVFSCIWYLIFGIVLISRPSLWMIQNTNSLNWEQIFCFAKEFTKVTWHLRHGGFNRIRQLIFHDYMSYRKINCTMPAKQTPHALTTPYIKGPWKLFIFPPLSAARSSPRQKWNISICVPRVDSCIPRCMIKRDNVSGDTWYLSHFWLHRVTAQKLKWNKICCLKSGRCHLVTPHISIFSWQQTLRQATNEKERATCYHFSWKLCFFTLFSH